MEDVGGDGAVDVCIWQSFPKRVLDRLNPRIFASLFEGCCSVRDCVKSSENRLEIAIFMVYDELANVLVGDITNRTLSTLGAGCEGLLWIITNKC